MRNLNIEDLHNKINKDSLDIEYIDKQHLSIKLSQFMNFLYHQQISSRLLERIGEDFQNLKTMIPTENYVTRQQQKEILSYLETSSEYQGAFGYFLIDKIFKTEKKGHYPYINIVSNWYRTTDKYDDDKDIFITLLFKPFIELLDWYITESKSYNSEDFFSKAEINEFEERLDQFIHETKLDFENLHEEIQDLKEQLKNLKKKNWLELFKGKFFDKVISKVITIENFNSTIEFISGGINKLIE